MDTFIECLVKKKRTATDFIAMVCIAVAASILAFILFMLSIMLRSLGSIAFLLMAALIYGAYLWITSFNVEYEYALVNDEMDVDKITNQRKRKRLTTVEIRGLEAFGTLKNSRVADKYIKDSSTKKVYACTDKENEDVYYAVYTEQDKKTMLLFNPTQKMVDVVVKRNPLKKQEFEIQ